MKKFALLTAGVAATLFFAACNSTEKQNTAAGAMGEKSACCTDAKKCDAKCTGDAKTCSKTECCQKKAAAPGAVSDKKEGCCSTTKTSAKAEGCCSEATKQTAAKADGCTATCPATKTDAKTCPMTGTTKDASMGAVSEKKEGCCKSQSSCTKQS